MNEIASACHVLENIELAGGSNAKLAMLKENDTPAVRFLLETALNPFLNYGVHLDESEHIESASDETASLDVAKIVRRELNDRKITGNEARSLVARLCANKDPIVSKWLHRVFNKNLRAGIAFGLVSKAFPGMIPSFDLALCASIGDITDTLPEGKWFLSKKIDGLRCVAFVDENYNVEFFSRGGKPFSNLGVIAKQLEALARASGKNNVVFDGEIYSKAGTWNATVSVVHADKSERDQTSVLYMIFDMVEYDQWVAKSTKIFASRYDDMVTLFGEADKGAISNLEPVVHTPVLGYASARKMMADYMAAGYEGVVLKEASSVYPFKRSKNWLKWKLTLTVDGKITKVVEGRGKYVGTLGALEILTEDGVSSSVGSGFSDVQRKEFWEKRDSLVGKIIEVEAQEKTKDGSLRFPIFKRFRVDFNI